MKPRFLPWCAWTAGLVFFLSLPGPAAAQPSAAPRPEDAAKAQALTYFEQGTKFLGDGRYLEAYDAFRKSLELQKSPGVMGNLASSLRQLARYDESLDAYESLLREYPNLPKAITSKVDTEMAELQELVGTLSLQGDLPETGSIFVDERLRGKLPLKAPLRLTVGMHQLRVEKDDFEPLTGTVDIKPRQNRVVELRAKALKGLLSVGESHNWPLWVEVDGKDVGVTPWAGMIAAGEHSVRLHGFIKPDTVM